MLEKSLDTKLADEVQSRGKSYKDELAYTEERDRKEKDEYWKHLLECEINGFDVQDAKEEFLDRMCKKYGDGRYEK